MRLRIAAICLIAGLGIVASETATACSVNWRKLRPPPLDTSLSSYPVVFVGTVTELYPPLLMRPGAKPPIPSATFRIEVPIKGVEGQTTIEVRNGRGGDCNHHFQYRQRWFIAGSREGASIFSGSMMLASMQDDPKDRPPSARVKALHKAFPDIMKLPPPLAKDQPADSKAPGQTQ